MAIVTHTTDNALNRPRRPYKPEKWPQGAGSAPRPADEVEAADGEEETTEEVVEETTDETTEETTEEGASEEGTEGQTFAERVSGA